MDNAYRQVLEFYQKRGFAGRVGFGKRPSLLVIDFIVAFTEPGSPLAGDLEKPLSKTLGLLEAARGAGVPIAFTTVEYSPDLHDAGLFPRKVAGLRLLVSGSRWVQLDPRLKRRAGEALVSKKFASGFFGTGLAQWLLQRTVDTVVITGCTTSGCIRATAVDALQYGFHAIVPREAVGDRAELPHVANLFDIDAKYGDVVDVEDVLVYFKGLKPEEAARTARQKRIPSR
jgi:maleamate amidohydrolase